MKCVLVGNYGVGNIGDEALRAYFLSAFPSVSWTIVTAEREAGSGKREVTVPRLPFGFRSLFRPWWKTIAAISRADALVFGGGSLFTDVESVWACVLWFGYAFTARCAGTPYFLAFQGAGPWKSIVAQRIARFVFRHAAFVSVRDERSLERVLSLGLQDVALTFDPVFSYFRSEGSEIRKKEGGPLVIIPRMNSDDRFVESAARIVGKRKSPEIRIVLMEPRAEEGIAHRLRKVFPQASVVPLTDPKDLVREVANASFVYSQRFHGGLAALALDTEFDVLPQREGDKLSELLRLRSSLSVEQIMQAIDVGRAALESALSR